MGTVNVSRDMDVVRRALGDEKLNFLGFSYGSRLGAVYAAQFPRSTGRMVLDGVGTLTRPLAARALVAARAQQQALDGFLAWCATQRDCVHGTDPRTAEEKVAALVARLDAQPLLRPDGSYGTGQDAVAAIAAAVDARSRWPALARALSRAERDGAPAALLQLGGPTDPTGPTAPRDEAGPDAAAAPVPADNGAAARVAVNCADDPDRSGDRATEAGVEQELADLEGEFRSASEIFGPLQLTAVLSCHGRPMRHRLHPADPPPGRPADAFGRRPRRPGGPVRVDAGDRRAAGLGGARGPRGRRAHRLPGLALRTGARGPLPDRRAAADRDAVLPRRGVIPPTGHAGSAVGVRGAAREAVRQPVPGRRGVRDHAADVLTDPDRVEFEVRAPRPARTSRSAAAWPTPYGISSSASAWYWYTGAAGAVRPSLLWSSRARQSGWASGSRVVRSEIRLNEPAIESIATQFSFMPSTSSRPAGLS